MCNCGAGLIDFNINQYNEKEEKKDKKDKEKKDKKDKKDGNLFKKITGYF